MVFHTEPGVSANPVALQEVIFPRPAQVIAGPANRSPMA